MTFVQNCLKLLEYNQECVKVEGKVENQKEKETQIFQKMKTLHKREESELYFIISMKWYKKWKAYITTPDSSPKPSKINNSDIIEIKNEKTQLKKRVSENKDYIVISEIFWNQLKKLYGCDNTLCRIYSGKKLNLYPDFIKLYLFNDDLEKEFILTEDISFSEILEIGEKYWKLKQEAATTRIWTAIFGSPFKLIDDLNIKLGEFLESNNGKEFFIEVKKDGSFPLDYMLAKYGLKTEKIKLKKKIKDQKKDDSKKSSIKNIKKNESKQSSIVKENKKMDFKKLGLLGLKNLTNTCFMNTGLQCFSRSKVIQNYFLNDLYKNDIYDANGKIIDGKGKISSQLANLYIEMCGRSTVTPDKFLKSFGEFHSKYTDGEQHDVAEFLTHLIEEINKEVSKKLIIKKEKKEDIIIEESIFTKKFQGIKKQVVTCDKCKKTSVKFPKFYLLEVPLEFQKRVFNINFVYIDPIKPITKLTVEVNKNGWMKEIVMEISKLCSVKEENIKLCNLYNGVIFKIYNENEEICNFSKDDIIFGFEVKCDVNYKLSEVCFQTEDDDILSDVPFIFPATNEMKCFELYDLCLEKLKVCVSSNKKLLCKEFSIDSEFFGDELFHINLVSNNKIIGYNKKKIFSISGLEIQSKLETFQFILTIPKKFENYFNFKLNKKLHKSFIKKTEKSLSLGNCIKEMETPVIFSGNNQYYCETCKKYEDAIMKTTIHSLPEVLIIQFSRKKYVNDSGAQKKLDYFVEFPFKLDLVKNLKENRNFKHHKLYAVSNHYNFGGPFSESGHYYAYVKVDGKNWYCFNDSSVSNVNENEICSKDAYVLFYEAKKKIDEKKIKKQIDKKKIDQRKPDKFEKKEEKSDKKKILKMLRAVVKIIDSKKKIDWKKKSWKLFIKSKLFSKKIEATLEKLESVRKTLSDEENIKKYNAKCEKMFKILLKFLKKSRENNK